MSENKCCGNCRFFGSEDLGGYGECQLFSAIRYCGDSCISYRPLFDSWTEITPDNVDMIDDGSIVIVSDGTYYNKASEWHLSIGTMAKHGGYYYYVLPELKIE